MARVGRFQVMATLQAARARALGLSEAEAESWGINRAIFYAAAKRGLWRTPVAKSTTTSTHPHPGAIEGERVSVGGEQAFAVEDPKQGRRFVIGGEAQTPEDFRRQVVARYSDWEAAWAEAQALIA